MLGAFYNTVFYEPLYNALVFLINNLPWHDLGFAIILLTFIVRLILFPLSHKSVITQRKMKEIGPEVSKIKEKFKKDKEEQTKQIMALYRAHGVSPFSGILMLFVQLPVLITLFVILRKGFMVDTSILYSFVEAPESINTVFLGVIDVSKPGYLFSALAGLSQFFQIRLAMPKIDSKSLKGKSFKNELQKSLNVQMKYIMPLFIFWISLKFSSALPLYWTTSNVFAILHEIVIAKKAQKIKHE